jgi:predicted O-methyltransferase YrrM
MKPIRPVLDEIIDTLPEGGQWCSEEKATTLAAMVFALRPKTVVEVGVWMGGSAIPLGIAMKATEVPGARLWAIDAWSPDASVAGQVNPADAKWWSEAPHEAAYQKFLHRIAKHELEDIVVACRSDSSKVNPPFAIEILHIDANHGEQVRADAQRFAPHVVSGGLVIMDDVGWSGGHVKGAVDWLTDHGFTVLYKLDPGLVLQRWKEVP